MEGILNILSDRAGQTPMILTIIVAVVVMLILAIFVMLLNPQFKSVTAQLNAQHVFSNDSGPTVTANMNSFSSIWDNAIVFFFMSVWFLLLVSAYYSRSNPIFFFIMIIMMIIMFVVIAGVGNTYTSLNTNPGMQAGSTDFPMTDWLLTYILEVFILVGFTTLLMTYKSREGSGGGL